MNGPLFVRPNLKWFLIGGLLVAAIHQLTTTGHSEGPQLTQITTPGYRASDEEIHQLLAYAVANPSAEAYQRVAFCYQKRGEPRRALLFLREADKIGEESFE